MPALLLILFTQLYQACSQLAGPYGQDCSFGVDDTPFATQGGCDVAGQSISDQGGKIECSENFDCCLCGSMICGSKGGSSCDEVNCNGDSGCFGVRDIQIYGSSDGGAVLSCNGDESCSGTRVSGENIAEIGCTGDLACERTVFTFSCVADEPCTIGCVGDGACRGNPDYASILSDWFAESGEDGPGDEPQTTIWTIDNTAGMECSAEACQYGVFTLLSNSGGGMISCDGYGACEGSQISINNIEAIICGATDSCKGASFLVIDPQQDFSVECSAVDSCSGLTLEIVVNNGVNFFKEINCGGQGCVGATFMIYNNGDQFITIENLGCEDPSSCENAVFDLDGGIGFENCKCGEESTHACDGISGIDSCLSGLESIECSGSDSCSGLQQAVANIGNDFELVCSDNRACRAFWLMIVLNTNAQQAVTSIKGYTCDGDEACMDAIVQLNNEQSGVSVVIDEIDCGGTLSCQNALFVTQGDVVINEISCADGACVNCMVEDASANTKLPCTSFD